MTKAFQPWGILHWPISAAGWLITVLPMAFLIQVFVAIDRNSHSVSDTLYAFYLYAGVTFLIWDWLARRLSNVT